ncbi:MAG TPA: flagellar basal body L-ring protein FlgH [Methylomusa anaerophila]|nr:flagellar basal body L-ring protein FlgH [Methylomusa anaerophila]HML89522.1 flagellar basal body L-ring protein FlgH [Methylomusa anaerophila]
MRVAIGFLLILAIIITMSPAAGGVQAESLWSDNSPAANIFSDHRAHAVGDILTIIISENSSASRSGSSSNSKSSSTSTTAGVGLLTFIDDMSASGQDSFDSKGAITNSNRVSGRVTVKVVEIKPNGDLVLSGTQSIKQNNEEQKITVTGTVRPYDVNSDNTVYSYNVADAQIRMDGKGPISAKQRQGILSQIFNFIF